MRNLITAIAVPATFCFTLTTPLTTLAHSVYHPPEPVVINEANKITFTSLLNLTDPASNGEAVGSSLFTGEIDSKTGAFRFKVDVLEPLSGFDPGIPLEQNMFTVHLHGSVKVLKENDRPVFSCTGTACLNSPRNPVPDQGPMSAADQLWSFHDVQSGQWIEIANLFSGGDTNQHDRPGSLSRIGGLSRSTKRDLGLTRLDDMLLGFWYAHTQTDDGNRVRGFLSPVFQGVGSVPGVQPTAAPLPAGIWMLLSALASLGLVRRRKSRAP